MNSMKNLFNGAIVIAVLFLSTGLVNAQQKIGHVNSNEIIQAMPEFVTANTAFENLQKEKEGELQQMGAEYQKKMTVAQDLHRNRSEANKDSVDIKLQSLGVELQDIESRINNVQQVAQEELQKSRKNSLPLFSKRLIRPCKVLRKKKVMPMFLMLRIRPFRISQEAMT